MYNVVCVSPRNCISGLSVITGFGEYDLSPRVAAFFTIVTSFVELLADEALEKCS